MKKKWTNIVKSIDFDKGYKKIVNCNLKSNYEICEWKSIPVKKITDGFIKDDEVNKQVLKKILKYCEMEIDSLETNVKLSKKYPNIYHKNVYVSDILMLVSFKKIQKKLKKVLQDM